MKQADKDTVLHRTEAYVEERMSGEGTGHDWWHVVRVRENARQIAQGENVDDFVVELAVLLHDIDDWKFAGGDEQAASKAARNWLEKLRVDSDVVDHVCEIVEHVSFKGSDVENKIATDEGRVVQDADRLDALGAIGIARAFAYGGHAGRELYNPEIKPELHSSAEAYKNARSTTINHFYEKLLLLKDRLNTETAKKIALQREEFMKTFLDRFYREWSGKA